MEVLVIDIRGALPSVPSQVACGHRVGPVYDERSDKYQCPFTELRRKHFLSSPVSSANHLS